MRDLTPQEFLAKMNHHLSIKTGSIKPEFRFIQDVTKLETIEDLLESALLRYKKEYLLIVDLVDEYNNKDTKSEQLNSPKSSNQADLIKAELLKKIISAKEKRDKLGEELLALRNRKEEIRRKSKGHKTESDRFFASFKNQVMLYSVVKVEFRYETSTFIILSKDIKERFSLEGLEHLKSDTPVARACLGKRVGDQIKYKVREEFDAEAKILECSLPSVEQIEMIISHLDSGMPHQIQEAPVTFLLHDLYGSNNSRLRKGG